MDTRSERNLNPIKKRADTVGCPLFFANLLRLQRADVNAQLETDDPCSSFFVFACAQTALQQQAGIRGVGLEVGLDFLAARGGFALIRS